MILPASAPSTATSETGRSAAVDVEVPRTTKLLRAGRSGGGATGTDDVLVAL
jgi:hypothetical protein